MPSRPSTRPEIDAKIRRLAEDGFSVAELADRFGLSKSAIRDRLKAAGAPKVPRKRLVPYCGYDPTSKA